MRAVMVMGFTADGQAYWLYLLYFWLYDYDTQQRCSSPMWHCPSLDQLIWGYVC